MNRDIATDERRVERCRGLVQPLAQGLDICIEGVWGQHDRSHARQRCACHRRDIAQGASHGLSSDSVPRHAGCQHVQPVDNLIDTHEQRRGFVPHQDFRQIITGPQKYSRIGCLDSFPDDCQYVGFIHEEHGRATNAARHA